MTWASHGSSSTHARSASTTSPDSVRTPAGRSRSASDRSRSDRCGEAARRYTGPAPVTQRSAPPSPRAPDRPGSSDAGRRSGPADPAGRRAAADGSPDCTPIALATASSSANGSGSYNPARSCAPGSRQDRGARPSIRAFLDSHHPEYVNVAAVPAGPADAGLSPIAEPDRADRIPHRTDTPEPCDRRRSAPTRPAICPRRPGPDRPARCNGSCGLSAWSSHSSRSGSWSRGSKPSPAGSPDAGSADRPADRGCWTTPNPERTPTAASTSGW